MNSEKPLSLVDSPGLPFDRDGPVFAEPWQAQAFAMTVALFEAGLFTWEEWAAALSTEISRAQEKGDPDLGDTYYHHWLTALETVTTEKGATDAATLSKTKSAWRTAYVNTPHGKPVEL